jgi:signal transduction histidine kinase
VRKQKFKTIIYLISFTVLVTVGIQVYRNIQNYNLNKQRFMNDVQVALDNSIEGYFASIATQFILLNETDSLIEMNGLKEIYEEKRSADSAGIFRSFSFSSGKIINGDTTIGGMTVAKNSQSGSQLRMKSLADVKDALKSISITKDSIGQTRLDKLQALTTQIVFSMTEDSVNFLSLNKFIDEELGRKKVNINYAIVSTSKDGEVERSREFSKSELPLSTLTKATYASSKKIEMYFENASIIILQRGLVDLLISLLISISVIGSLLYLYKIINQQKQLAEIKNDLISNITHEFKTPIATVTSALEGIANFNKQNDQEKTAKYLDISNDQLKKLNLMVEKLLETATLDSDELTLKKEPLLLSALLEAMVEKYKMLAGDKRLTFVTPNTDVVVQADPFHLENALSNLIDNAIKYGGNAIQVVLTPLGGHTQIVVQDNGGHIEKSQKERVFDKFYRIPTGNQHDVKGFGIGLYHTKKILEKHGGQIHLILKPQLTRFEVTI